MNRANPLICIVIIFAVLALIGKPKQDPPPRVPPPGVDDVYFYIDSQGHKHWVEMMGSHERRDGQAVQDETKQ